MAAVGNGQARVERVGVGGWGASLAGAALAVGGETHPVVGGALDA